MGFKSISFARIDEEERDRRAAEKSLEFEWRPEYQGILEQQTSNFSIFAHVLSGNYQAPCGLHVYTYET
jgi:hypothetical protein